MKEGRYHAQDLLSFGWGKVLGHDVDMEGLHDDKIALYVFERARTRELQLMNQDSVVLTLAFDSIEALYHVLGE